MQVSAKARRLDSPMMGNERGVFRHSPDTTAAAVKSFIKRQPKKSSLRKQEAAAAAAQLESCTKCVQFADSLGYDLHMVKFYDTLEDFAHMMQDLERALDKLDYREPPIFHTRRISPPTPQPPPTPCTAAAAAAAAEQYSLPALSFNASCESSFLLSHQVKLETLRTEPCPAAAVHGTVLVHNRAFDKRVAVRYTTDYWRSSHDIEAQYENSKCAHIDRFAFTIPLCDQQPVGGEPSRPRRLPAILELCIMYTCGGGETSWDSNDGNNYKLYKLSV